MTDLSNMNPAALKMIAKMATDAFNKRRAELGQTAGEFAVDETVVLHAQGVVKVSKSTPNKSTPQAAVPWNIITALIAELNTERAAAGKAGIDMEKVIELAEAVDPEMAKKAQKAADARVAAIKEPTRRFAWGSVSPQGEVAVLATGNHLAEDAEPEAANAG